MTYVEENEHTVKKKTAIMIQHFIQNCVNELDGQAKAMVVCASRAQAVKYKIAFDEYLKQHNLAYKALVAFSGSVTFEGIKYSYTESGMNGFPDDQTAQKFKESERKFLIVANKFQTGFDQPLLYAMYVNKKLQGVNAVQTLSRLNRVHEGKKDPITLDFVNDAELIKRAFQDFYEDTTLVEASDPDKLYDLQRSLEEFHYYTKDEVIRFARVFFSKSFSQDKLNPILLQVVDRFNHDDEMKQNDFRAVLKAYIRMYSFLSQIISFTDVELEKLYAFARILQRKLPVTKNKLPREITQQVDLDSIRIQFNSRGLILEAGQGGQLKPGDENPAGKTDFMEPLSLIIKAINERFGADFTDADKVVANEVLDRIRDNSDFAQVVQQNPRDAAWLAFERMFNSKLQDRMEEHFDFYKKLNNNPDLKSILMKEMFTTVYAEMAQ